MAADFGFDPVKEGARYFISYTVEDRERVGEVVRCLNRAGVPLWYDRGSSTVVNGKDRLACISVNVKH